MERDVNLIQISFEHDQRKENANKHFLLYFYDFCDRWTC